MKRPLDSIRIGKRHRKDMGDIEGLALSLADVGLLHPIVVTPDGTLIAGERRLRAAQLLGWAEIPVTVVDLTEIVRGELAENADRKDFLPSEIDALRRKLEPMEKAAAKARMAEGGKVGKVSTPSRARDRIGAFAGISGRTVDKIAAVVEAAEAEPERFNKLLADMDRTGRVNGVYRRLKNIKQAALIRAEPPPLPMRGPYRVIVADPPWPYEKGDEDPSRRGALPYPTMSIAEICALPVGSIAADDSILWLWITNHHKREAYDVLDAWGFEQKTILTWAKDHFGNGDWLRGQTEHCLMAVRGKPVVTLTNQSTLLYAPRQEHSRKPDQFYERVESLCPAPRYAELFARTARPGWDGHGNEVQPGEEWQERDSIESYNEAVREIGKQVKAGAPVPEFMKAATGTVCRIPKGCRYGGCEAAGHCLARPAAAGSRP